MSKEMWNFEIEVLISSFSDKWIIRNYGENKNFVIYIEIFPESYFFMYIYFLYIFIVIFLNIFTKLIIYKMYKHSM